MSTPVRVLVCDDDPLLLELLEFRLAAKGFDVQAARDGGEAMQLLESKPPSAVVLDAMMPFIDGYEVLRRIRENPTLKALPVIMLTARKQEKDIVGALELGASDFLAKPFIPEELVARLIRLTGPAQ
ncbi:response regulator transcription factor [Sphingomonas edaphi]|uniref:Response regulator n=1 Tax=Sphingomonas edaphi TaxID=2315689 RepID=A0A418PYD1_9SPHN|nr:response regulator [Sphingomonas edaphi]RIX26995.1 response regulator [Sphingomonas edaphi]